MTLMESMKLTYTDYRDWYRIGLKLRNTPADALMKPHVLLSYLSARIRGVMPSPVFDKYIAELKGEGAGNAGRR